MKFDATPESIKTRAFRAALILVALVFILWAARTWSEPRYLGRGVRSWIEQLPWDNSSNSEAQEALRFFDTRAIPYLLEAINRPVKWERGVLAKIPRRYIATLVDVDQQLAVRRSAIWRIRELLRDETEKNENPLSSESPVADRILPLLKQELRNDLSGEFIPVAEDLGDRMTNVTAEIRELYPRLNPSRHEWVQASLILSEWHNPELVPLFISRASSTNSEDIRAWAITALGRNGIANEDAAQVIRNSLQSTNVHLCASALRAAAYLGVCSDEALSAINKRGNGTPLVSREVQAFEIVEPILLWQQSPDDPERRRKLEENLSERAKGYIRSSTIDILRTLGPKARPFVASLEKMAREQGTPFRSRALGALRKIDPAAAQKLLPLLPPLPPKLPARGN